MFKEITSDKINAEEIKNRILAYASIKAAEEVVDDNYWYGNISTYTLNLRLSGIYGEKQFTDIISSNVDTTLNIGKYIYLENADFIRETQHLDNFQFVQQLYQAFLRRAADEGGLKGNVEQLNNGAPRKNLVMGLRSSGEADGVFLRVTDCLDDETFIDIAHRVYLNPENRQLRREQDLAALEQGQSRIDVFQQLKQFQQLQTVLQNLKGDFYQEDEEFLAKTNHLSNEDFVKTLYLTFLKREADPGGLESQVQQIINGVSRHQLLYGLRTSEEAANVFVDRLTRSLDNETFIEVSYLAYRKQKLTPQQKQQNLQILQEGQIRQTILRNCPPLTVIYSEAVQATPSVIHPEEETEAFHLKVEGEKNPSSSSQITPQLCNTEIEIAVTEVIEPKEETVSQPSVNLSDQEVVLEQLKHNFYQEDETFVEVTQELNNEDFVKTLYRTFLKREADPDGLASQVEQLDNNVSRWEVLYALRTSQEAANVFVDLTAQLDHESFLEIAYIAYLKRELDPEIKPFYLEHLNQGKPRQEILS